ncbi:unnamed protein product [Phyllotreta striolata]|uniref:Uncharacterized protein n=1 Tax=Phyllotreta striolata TaxID=444603 RepID=A0A9N9XN85_PHYSR|nr:unnamed protein product [Phyllotreta striolata]
MIKSVTNTYRKNSVHFSDNNRYMCTGFDPRKIYLLGEKHSGLKARGALQKFDEIRDKCIENNVLFEDPQFPPQKIVLGEAVERYRNQIKWLRPKDIAQNCIFFEEGEHRFDVNQGELGDCWFLAALAEIAQNQKCLQFIVPDDQNMTDKYAGIFHFRFWNYGRWIDVVIDDRLPTINGNLIFDRYKDKNVFWTPLLEKAYAKLYGSYKNIEGGFISEALEDFTGGLNELYLNLQDYNKDFFEMMQVSYNRKSYMGCGILTNSGGTEGERDDGLFSSHAYSITSIAEVTAKDGTIYKLIRLRNPWGQKEYNGDWSDNSPTWDLLPEDTKNSLLRRKDDGEFWMQYEYFITAYNLLEFCHPNPDSLAYNPSETHQWKCFMLDGAWIGKVSNGGTPSNRNFYLNSQYILTINEKNLSASTHKVLIGLMQKNRRLFNLPELPIGFAIYSLKVPAEGPLPANFFSSIRPAYIRKAEFNRQVVGQFDLPNGIYCIIPFTEDARSSCEYLLRVYSTVDFSVGENDVEVRFIDKSASAGMYDTVDGVSADKAVGEVFANMAGESEEIGWKELKSILDLLLKQENREFSKELCRSMIALADSDLSGKLNFNEFYQLWEQIGNLRGVFRTNESEKSSALSTTELRSALKATNLQISNKILRLIILRYSDDNGEIDMEDFLHCCIKLKIMIDNYNSEKKRGCSLEKWLLDTIYT